MLFTEALLSRLAVHYAGNKQNGQPILLSQQEQDLDTDLGPRLAGALLQRFRDAHERYSFHHSSSLEYHEVFNYVKAIFAGAEEFLTQSQRIATQLYEASVHPKIRPGELYVTYFSNIIIDDIPTDAIGLFKAETRSLFADVDPAADGLHLSLKEGAELARLDKGCLILNHQQDEGYELLIFDSNGKGEEAIYWKDKFLGVLIRQNEFLHTQGFLTITKNFVTQKMPDEFEVSRTEQIDLLNRSMDYFKTHDQFSKSEFETEVLHHDDLIQSFRQYDQQYRESNPMAPADEFYISPQAVKKQARVFKSVIKLDKNFHIYVHGDRELIEKGYDEALGKHYYKIYFDREA
jgi:hypothetical protein